MTAVVREKCHGQGQVTEMKQMTNPAHIIESIGNEAQKAEVPGRRRSLTRGPESWQRKEQSRAFQGA